MGCPTIVGNDSIVKNKNPEKTSVSRGFVTIEMARTGFEQSKNTATHSDNSIQGDAESGAEKVPRYFL